MCIGSAPPRSAHRGIGFLSLHCFKTLRLQVQPMRETIISDVLEEDSKNLNAIFD
jgi:hypothetical protein